MRSQVVLAQGVGRVMTSTASVPPSIWFAMRSSSRFPTRPSGDSGPALRTYSRLEESGSLRNARRVSLLGLKIDYTILAWYTW